MNNATQVTFESGYQRLQTIASRLNEEEVPVSEMCDLFAEGKGLERALTSYLDEQRARVEAIERGEGIHAFEIVAGQPAESPQPTTDLAAASPTIGQSLARDGDEEGFPF